MLDILGWQFDREGPKSDAFSGIVSALGVQFDLEDSPKGILKVRNTAKRIEDTTLLLETWKVSKERGTDLAWQTGILRFFYFWSNR